MLSNLIMSSTYNCRFLLSGTLYANWSKMLVKWIQLGVLVYIISMTATKHIKDVDFEDLSESVEDKGTPTCDGENCPFASTKKQKDLSTQNEYEQPNLLDLLKLLSSTAKNGNKGDINISINVRDIQSGFRNGGSKYHVGNIHRELTREKRDTNSSTDVPVVENDSIDTNSYEINKVVDTNTQTTEENNFQDSNASGIYDPVTNDTDTEFLSVSGNNGINGSDTVASPEDVDLNVPSQNPDSKVLTVSKVDDKNDNLQRFRRENDSRALHSEIKLPISKNALINIQNVFSDDLGVESEGVKTVANFTVNVDTGKNNPVIVVVYNCSCESNHNHTHDNSTEIKLSSDDSNDNDQEVSVTQNPSNDDQDISVKEDKLSEPVCNTEINPDVVENKKNNAYLENAMLQKCKSLLSLQQKNKEKEVSEIELNEAKAEVTKPLSRIETVSTSTLSQVDANVNSTAVEKVVFSVDDSINAAVSNLTANIKLSHPAGGKAIDNPKINSTRDAINALEKENTTLRNNSDENATFSHEIDESNKNGNDKNSSVEIDIEAEAKPGPHNNSDDFNAKKSRPADQVDSNTLIANNTNDDDNRHRRSIENVLNYVHSQYKIIPTVENFKDTSYRTKRDIKVRNPKYYEYFNDQPSSLESGPNTDENDSIIVSFESFDKPNEVNGFDGISNSVENNIKENSTLDKYLFSLLTLKPINLIVYLNLTMNNLEKQNDY